jgi:hypothetical protein
MHKYQNLLQVIARDRYEPVQEDEIRLEPGDLVDVSDFSKIYINFSVFRYFAKCRTVGFSATESETTFRVGSPVLM